MKDIDASFTNDEKNSIRTEQSLSDGLVKVGAFRRKWTTRWEFRQTFDGTTELLEPPRGVHGRAARNVSISILGVSLRGVCEFNAERHVLRDRLGSLRTASSAFLADLVRPASTSASPRLIPVIASACSTRSSIF